MTNNPDGKCAICVPERGNWAGGDNVLMVLTELDRKNGIFYSLLFIQHLFCFCCSIPYIFRFFGIKSENKYSARTGRYEDDYLSDASMFVCTK
jgi:hypothetical protein